MEEQLASKFNVLDGNLGSGFDILAGSTGLPQDLADEIASFGAIQYNGVDIWYNGTPITYNSI